MIALASRNLFRNGRRTALTTAAIAFGLALFELLRTPGLRLVAALIIGSVAIFVLVAGLEALEHNHNNLHHFYRKLRLVGEEAIELVATGGLLTAGLLAMQRMGDAPAAGSPVRGGTMTFEVDDCDDRYAWALAHGGAEALPPTDFPGIGRCAYVEDGQGNIVGMISPVAEA